MEQPPPRPLDYAGPHERPKTDSSRQKGPTDDARKPESGARMVIGFYLSVGVVVLVVGLLIFLSHCAADFLKL
jgi:hypothetical protein